jgi:hypothetical protein
VVGVLSTHYERPYRPSQQELVMLRRLGCCSNIEAFGTLAFPLADVARTGGSMGTARSTAPMERPSPVREVSRAYSC